MQRYFFATDGEGADTVGSDYADVTAAKHEAVVRLGHAMCEEPEKFLCHRSRSVTVSSLDGEQVFSMVVTIEIRAAE